MRIPTCTVGNCEFWIVISVIYLLFHCSSYNASEVYLRCFICTAELKIISWSIFALRDSGICRLRHQSAGKQRVVLSIIIACQSHFHINVTCAILDCSTFVCPCHKTGGQCSNNLGIYRFAFTIGIWNCMHLDIAYRATYDCIGEGSTDVGRHVIAVISISIFGYSI